MTALWSPIIFFGVLTIIAVFLKWRDYRDSGDATRQSAEQDGR